MSNYNHKKHKNHNNKTKKKHHIQGKIIEKKQGWTVIEIKGRPYERGYAHGFLLANDLKTVLKIFPFIVKNNLHVEFSHYMSEAKRLIKPVIKRDFPEFYEEMRGISNGAKQAGLDISTDLIIAWNSYMSLYGRFNKNGPGRCSAFIAAGSATENGDIVMAHNTHTDFVDAQTIHIIMYVYPTNGGKPFVMQTSAGYISSVSDWFICSSGIMGCETTISQINYKPIFGAPFFCRVRQAMQYGKTLDEYVAIMLKDNAGDYACSWLFGDTNTGEIMLFELGLTKHNIERTKDGTYYGMNAAIDFILRSEETDDKTLMDLKTSSGSRNIRLNHLLNEQYYGKINTTIAKRVLSDHYDSFLNKTKMDSRGICKHSEMDNEPSNRKPYYPFGCIDGKVTNTKMAKNLEFMGRFGSCCGRTFSAKAHIKQHPAYKEWLKVLPDFPYTEWTKLSNK